MYVLIIDCLTGNDGKRVYSRDFIGSGPRYIAGFIEKLTNKKWKTKIIRGEQYINEEKEFIGKFPLIGISGMSMDEVLINRVISKWESSFKSQLSRLCILGGPITSDNLILNKINCDIVFHREVENSLSMFLEKADIIEHQLINRLFRLDFEFLEKIEGISYRKNNKIIFNKFTNKSYENIYSFYKKSSGYANKIKNYPNYKFSRVYVDLLRGCSNFRRTSMILKNLPSCGTINCNICRTDEFSTIENCPLQIPAGCGFCSSISFFKNVKSRDLEYIIKEINHLIQIGCLRIVLGAPDFLDFYREMKIEGKLISPSIPSPNYEVLNLFIKELLKIAKIREKKVQIFIENIKASLVDEKVLKILSKIPNCIFSIGCETGSEEFSNIIGRPSTPKQTYNAIKNAKKFGIRAHVYFIHSLPGDNLKFAHQTLLFLKELAQLNVEKFTLYKFKKLPGSPFYSINKNNSFKNKKYQNKIKEIKKYIIDYNKKQKLNMVGKVFEVYISEPNNYYKNDAIGWLLEGGPKINIIDGKKKINSFQKVRIIKILSDKLLMAQLLNSDYSK